MFTCTLNPQSRTTLCDQLYEALRAQIVSGAMSPGERLPSKRQLSAHLSVSQATVEAAYARLVSEGYCVSRPRSGMYVAGELPQDAPAAPAKEPPIRWDFSTGTADAEHFPYAAWARLMREVLSEQSTALLMSGDPQGFYALRCELSSMLRSMRGVEAAPERIVLGGGVSKAGDYLLRGVERHFQEHMFHACKGTEFSLATLGNEAGMYGAFYLLKP